MSNRLMLVFELRHVGDAVLSLPFVRGARSAWDVHVICRPQTAPLFQAVIMPHSVHPYPAPWKDAPDLRSAIAMARLLAKGSAKLRPEVAVCAWADARVHALMSYSEAKVRVGFPMNARNVLYSERRWRRNQVLMGRILDVVCRLAFARAPLNRRLTRAKQDQHHVDDWLQIATALDITPDASVPWLSFPEELSGSARSVRDRLQLAKKNGKRRWLIHPGAGDSFRRWPAARFAQIAGQLAESGAAVLVISPADAPVASFNDPRVLTWTPDSLPDFVSIAGHVDFVLANDSMATHIASALGKPAVAIFGPGNPGWFGPLTPGSEVVWQPACNRWPCLRACERDCCACLEALEPAVVMEAVRRVEDRIRQ